MTSQPVLNLNQLQVLLTIVETGSFTAAAKQLSRATSVVSYTIDTLESQLGLKLFHRGTSRRAELTKEGEAVVAEARAVANGADKFRARVRGLRDGLEAEVSLAVDEMYPAERLSRAMKSFHEQFPDVSMRLNGEVLGGVERLVRSGLCGLGIGGTVHIGTEGMTQHQIDGVRIIPVAAPCHLLAQSGPANLELARAHLQIVTTERYGTTGRCFGVFAEKIWRVSGQTAKHALLLAGVGWGGMPEPIVREDIKAGRLVHLDLADFRGSDYSVIVVHRDDMPPGPAARWLIDHLIGQSASGISAEAA